MHKVHRDHLIFRALDEARIFNDISRAREWLVELDRPDSPDLAAVQWVVRFVDPNANAVALERSIHSFTRAWPHYYLFAQMAEVVSRGISGPDYRRWCLGDDCRDETARRLADVQVHVQ